MKKVFYLIIAVGSLIFSSCEKEIEPEVVEQSTAVQAKEIQVEYEVYAASGKANVVAVVSVNGELTEQSFEITRMNQKISFTTMSQQELMIKATNSTPSHEEVIVTIKVNGNLFESNSTTEANGWAIAKGIPQ